MSISVADVIALPGMSGYTLLSGVERTGTVVNAISVLDKYEPEYQYDWLYPNQKYLTGKIFISTHLIRASVEHQCMCIRFLHRAGASALILFHVGLFADCVDPEVIRVANALQFPIIQLPSNRHYSDVITAIMAAVLHSQGDKNDLQDIVLGRIAQLPENQRTADALIRTISNFTHLSIALYDRSLYILHEASWLTYSSMLFSSEGFTPQLRTSSDQDDGSFVTKEGDTFYFSFFRVSFQDSLTKYLAILSETGPVPVSLRNSVSEVIRQFFAIWGKSKEDTRALCHAILNNELVKAQQLAKLLEINLGTIRYLLICKPVGDISKGNLEMLLSRVEHFFEENHMQPIICIRESFIAVFMAAPSYATDFCELTKAFQAEISRQAQPVLVFLCQHLAQLSTAKSLFALFETYVEYARRLFTQKHFFSEQEMQFTQSCVDIIQTGEGAIRNATAILAPLAQSQNLQHELHNTLAAFLIDADGVHEKAAGILFVHKSTVKYRINKATQLLGFDVRKMPELQQLYQALAINRLMGLQ